MNPISNTAFYCCGVRVDDMKRERPICNDIYAERFMDEAGKRIYEPFKSEKMPNISNITRCRIIDDYISLELKNFDRVNIITIGAGFDTRPYRLTGGNWIELDEPQIIRYKNKQLPIEECKNSLQRISIDFSMESLISKLENIEKHPRTIIIIEGVFMYLENKAIEKTLKEIKQVIPKHELYCDLMNKVFFEKFAQSIHSKLVAAGAKFSNRPDNPQDTFDLHNYRLVERISMFKRAGELGILWNEVNIPGFIAGFLLKTFMKDLGGYSVYHFSNC